MSLLRRAVSGVLILVLVHLALPPDAEAQRARLHRVGVIHLGETDALAIDGLRDGLKEAGLQEGKQFVLEVRNLKGDLKGTDAAARELEARNADLIYAPATTIALMASKATKHLPVVFFAGTDPIVSGLVQSLRQPGGRLTGVYGQFGDLAIKRLELLKAMVPGLRKVVVFYRSDNLTIQRNLVIARDTARQLQLEIVERRFSGVAELRAGVESLRPDEADALLYVPDVIVNNQAQWIVERAIAKKLPTMFASGETVAQGALASYGVSFHAVGRVAARYVHRILQGADPGKLPVEQIERLQFVINVKTAKALGLRIPDVVLARADEVIE